MRFEAFLDQLDALHFPRSGDAAHPDRPLVQKARALVEEALLDDEFLADCIARELDLIESAVPRRGLVPFFTMPGLGVRFALGYWAPGHSAGAHEHTAWTVTAVCRNELEVLTYDRAESYRTRQLVPKNRFHAEAGRVGFISEPCIHEPKNMSPDWSLSFHMSSPLDGKPPEENYEELPMLRARRRRRFAGLGDHPYARVVSARQRHKCVHLLARITASMQAAEGAALRERCRLMGTMKTRKFLGEAPERSRHVTLARAHPGLGLSLRDDGDMVALDAETPQGLREEFAIADSARAAMAFIAREEIFAAAAIPGSLSDAERMDIVAVLEETGLFRRIGA
ncbi:hypothetical protein [Taklimakanibacter deserti]|uniref:hypothetical protein n=1 Tax=Taklimakanibacter deserti TaxID=2267839 RepID=UPI000E6488E2